ncbi:MAG: endonuclease/exonuclease/phosphatase family protein [Eubacterium sp.]
MSSKCPKCGEKIKPTYLKQACPKCGVNMLYYKLDEQLEADAERAQAEVDAVNRFTNMLKDSSVKTPWHIIRLVLFFTPLASMCLPMFWAGHKNVSLITLVMSIINHGFDLGAIASDKSYLFAVLSMVLVIVLSLVEIICSLFSATKNGFVRNLCVFGVNFVVLCVMSFLATAAFGGYAREGLFVTLAIYIAKLVLHCVIGCKGNKKRFITGALVIALIPCLLLIPYANKGEATICPAIKDSDVKVVSFNVASAFGTGLEDTDSMVRCRRFSNYMNAFMPDFIGTQEMNSYWMEQLKTDLPEYEGYGVKRGGDSEEKNSEMNSIFWLKDKYDAEITNTIWLSDTPDVASKYTYVDNNGKQAEAGCNRVCSYAILKDKNGNMFAFMNTHLDNASEQARVFGADVILKEIEKIETEYKDIIIILTGDFNETAEDEAVKLIKSRLTDANVNNDNCATYQEWGYRQTGDMPIDFIFTNQRASDYLVLGDINNGYVSDHYGIYAGLEIGA